MAKKTPEQLAAEAARKEAKKAEKAERKAALKERQKIKKDEAKKSLDDFMTDVKALAGEKKDDAANAIIHFSVNAMDKAEDASIEAQRIRLKPVFYDQIKISPAPDMIYICEQDKAHKSSSVCKGSIGHMARAAKMDVLYLYPESVDIYGVTFIPTEEEDVYYRHPFGENKYNIYGLFLSAPHQWVCTTSVGGRDWLRRSMASITRVASCLKAAPLTSLTLTTGCPSSLPLQMLATRGICPSSSTPSVSASCLPPS